MNDLAEQISEILCDYHSHKGFNFDPKHVLNWVSQFPENDQKFLLTEFLHILKKGTYVNEQKARELLISNIEAMTVRFRFRKPIDFLANTTFLTLQPKGKSQDILLAILDEELQKKYGVSLKQCGSASERYSVYVDDILATGGTVFRDCVAWLALKNTDETTNLDRVISNKTTLIICVFCRHNWSSPNYRLKLHLNKEIDSKILFHENYTVENHPNFPTSRFNFAYPTADQPDYVIQYWENLAATNKQESAFRKPLRPSRETFFSSAENRNRFENILLHKGIELLLKAQKLKPNHRPLGAVTPSYKTLGTGTLFFTWRNISNTTPIVFWWAAPGAGWYPLFPLHQRGGNMDLFI